MSRPFTEIPEYINGLFKEGIEALSETVTAIKERLSQEGKPVRYPIDWDSERQRRAFFATNGFGKGIPYRRTHAMRLGIKEERVPLGSNLRIPHPGGAVYGLPGSPSTWQSRIHRGLWPYLLEVLFDELAKLPARLSNRITVRGDK